MGYYEKGIFRGLSVTVAFSLEIAPFLCYFYFVRIFKTTWFARFADKEDITDGELRELVNQLEMGQADADLGGGSMKKYGSEALMVTHQQAEGLHRLGIISDAVMKEFDEDCLVQDPEPAEKPEKPLKIEQVTI